MHKDDYIKLTKATGIGHWMASEACDEIFEWGKWSQEIPYIQFPAHWKVKIVPPHASAIIRFRVQMLNDPNDCVSVYLDCYNHLGYGGLDPEGKPIPYWEIYPAAGGDTDRFLMHEIEELLIAIEAAIQ